MTPPTNSKLFPFGVALASLATIALELLLTRIYSVTMYYHFAFMVISLALLGLAVSGVALYLFPKFFAARSPGFWGALAMLGFSAGVLFALRTALANPISLHGWRSNWGTLVAVYLSASVPFLCSGFALSIAIASAKEQIGKIYAFDLIGASLGCLLIVPLLPPLGGPGAIVGIAALGAAAAVLFALTDRQQSRIFGGVAIAAAIVLSILSVRETSHHVFGLARNPDKFLGKRQVLFEKWNAFSQITVGSSADPDHRWLFIDADAATRMWSKGVNRGNQLAPRRIPEVRVASLVYTLRHGGTALIIGPGGGTDVLSALSHGVPRVVGVEVNPIIANDVVRSAFAEWNGDLYRDPRVNVVVDEGRSYIRRAQEPFASIQATLVDTWAASSSGAFTLSENNIYTVEAFSEFLAHLAPNGIVAVTRWYDAGSPKEFLRLTALAREALERRGVRPQDVAAHIAVATDNERRANLLLSRDPLTSADLQLLKEQVATDRLTLLFTPGGTTTKQGGTEDAFLHSFLEAPDANSFLGRLRYDAVATSDDRPFFFYSLRLADLVSIFAKLGSLEMNNLGVAVLLLLLLFSVVMTLVLVVAPMLILRRDALRHDRGRKLRILGYFLCLGLGYILVEIGFMQKFVLFLGHPIYALAVVLASLLAASGTGSALSGWGGRRYGTTGFVWRVLLALAGILAVYALTLTSLFHLFLGLPLFLRIGIAVVLLAPAGVLMGTLLPTGMRVASQDGPEGQALVAWAWSANGAASVVGSVVAITLAMNFGFTLSLVFGIAIYLAAGALLPAQRRHSQTP